MSDHNDDKTKTPADFLAGLFGASRGNGTCQRCDGPCPPITSGGITVRPIICNTCAEADAARADERACLDQLRRYELSVGWESPEMYEAIELYKGVAWPRPLAQLGTIPIGMGHAVLIQGATGTGKTALGMAWMHRRAAEAIHAMRSRGNARSTPWHLYAREDELALALDDRRNAAQLVDDWSRAEVVFLDDLGSAVGDRWAWRNLQLILCNRHAARRLTILSTNHRLRELLESPTHPVYDERIVTRIVQMIGGGALRVELTQPHRTQASADLRAMLSGGNL